MSSRKGAFSRWPAEVMVERKMLVDVDGNNMFSSIGNPWRFSEQVRSFGRLVPCDNPRGL